MNYFKAAKFLLVITVLSVAIVSVSTLFPFIVGKYVWFRTSVDLALIFFLLGLLFSREAQVYETRFFKIIKHPLVLAVTAFTVFFLLACFFGFNPANSFWSNFERGEGGFQIIHLYVFFLLLTVLFKEETDWQKIFGWSLVGALLMAAYGFLAGQVQGFIGPAFGSADYRFQGSIGNPSYVAAYLIFAMFYCVYLWLNSGQKKITTFKNVILTAIFIVLTVTFFLAATRGAFLGLIAALIAALSYIAYAYKPWRKRIVFSAVLIFVLLVSLIFFRHQLFAQNNTVARIFDISFVTQTFHDRLIIWQMAWSGFLVRPILGWGPENFLFVFDTHFAPAFFNPAQGFGAWFDKAHNVFFDYLVETGILGLLAYISIFVAFYFVFFRFKRENSSQNNLARKQLPIVDYRSLFSKALIFAVPVAYLVQGVVLFDVLTIYLNLFLFLAFAVYQFKTKSQ